MKNIYLDLGGHRGQGLRYFIKNILDPDKDWEIHTFEPNSLVDIESTVNTHFTNYDITIHREAVWIENGEKVFELVGGDGKNQGSLLKDTGGGKNYDNHHSKVTVQAIDIWEFINKFSPEDEIFIKMDIEWAEYTVIPYMLKKGWPKNIKSIWIEWHYLDHYDELKEKSEYLLKEIRKTGTKVETEGLYLNYK